MILTPVQYIEKFRREISRLYVIPLESPFCFPAAESMKVIMISYMDKSQTVEESGGNGNINTCITLVSFKHYQTTMILGLKQLYLNGSKPHNFFVGDKRTEFFFFF